MTLIEAAMTMLADSLLPTVFWDEAVNTACYVLNRVLVTKPHNKTPYELIIGRPPSISFMRPFGCPVTILNTLDPLGKFDGKAEEGFLVRSFRESYLEQAAHNSFNNVAHQLILVGGSRIFGDDGSSFVPLSKFTNLPHDPLMPDLEDTAKVQNTGIFGSAFDDEDLDTYNSPFADQVIGAEADFNHMEPSTIFSPIPTTIVHSIHPKDQIIGDPKEWIQVAVPGAKTSWGAPAQTRMDTYLELTVNVPITPHDSPLQEVLDLEKKKDAQVVEILKLKKRVKRLERQRKSSTSQPRRMKYIQVESSDDDLNEEDASKQRRSSDKTEPMLCNC
ncbi:ribonuclease H-like domain-containing protein [Tanacetum coccineum]